jgi:hypothetical protein
MKIQENHFYLMCYGVNTEKQKGIKLWGHTFWTHFPAVYVISGVRNRF